MSTWRPVFSWMPGSTAGETLSSTWMSPASSAAAAAAASFIPSIDDLVEVDRVRLVVPGRLDERHTAGLVWSYMNGPDADRVVPEVRPSLGERRRGEHEHVVADQRRVARLHVEHDRVRAGRGDAGDVGVVARARRARDGHEALDARGDRLRVERRAVVELDPLPELNRVGQLVLRRASAGRRRASARPRCGRGSRRPRRAAGTSLVDLDRQAAAVQDRVQGGRVAVAEADHERPAVAPRFVRAGGGRAQRQAREPDARRRAQFRGAIPS